MRKTGKQHPGFGSSSKSPLDLNVSVPLIGKQAPVKVLQRGGRKGGKRQKAGAKEVRNGARKVSVSLLLEELEERERLGRD